MKWNKINSITGFIIGLIIGSSILGVSAQTIPLNNVWLIQNNNAGVYLRNDNIDVLIGAENTSTPYALEVHDDIWASDSIRTNQFCINTTTPDCITSWPTGGTTINQLGEIGDVTTSTPMTYGEILRYNTGSSIWESVATSTLLVNTDDTVEGTNLYYTDARVSDYISTSSTLPAFFNYWTLTGTELSYNGFTTDGGAATSTYMHISEDLDVLGELNNLATIDGTTYSSLQDWFNVTQSSGKTSGGTFTLSNGDGTLGVSSGTGIIRASGATDIEPAMFMDWTATTTLELTDNSTNYIYVDYNSGDPEIGATITKTDANNRSVILLGKVYREGTTLHEVEAGMVVTEVARKVLTYLNGLHGEIVRFAGLVTTETGDLNIAITAGTGSAGLTPASWSAIDTSGADTFRYWYNDGAWQSSDVSVINATQYNDYGTGLADLQTNNHYGTHYVYMHFDGDVHIVYGIDDYITLAGAELASTPANLPNIVSDFSLYIGKIIVKKTETSSFTDVRYPWTDITTTGLTGAHSALSDLIWTDSGHSGTVSTFAGFDGAGATTNYTEANYLLADGTRALTADWTTSFGLTMPRSTSTVYSSVGVDDGNFNWTAGDLNASGDGYIGGALSIDGILTANSSTTFNGIEYLYPATDGSNTNVLTTNGAGGLSWAAKSGLWTDQGAYIDVISGDGIMVNNSSSTITQLQMNSATSSIEFTVGSDTSTASSTLSIGNSDHTNGGCFVIEDIDGLGATYCTTLNGTMTCSTNSCL